MDLHQLATQVELHRGRIPPRPQRLAHQGVARRIQRLGDLDMAVPVELRVGPHRRVERRSRNGEQQRELLGAERLGRPALGRAVDAPARRRRAPRLGAHPAVGQVDEGLPGEEVSLHVVDHPFDAWLVRRGPHSGRVDEEAAVLRVLHEHVVEPRRAVLRVDDDRLHVVGDHHREHPGEEPPCSLEPADHLLGGLRERRPHELMSAEARREDQPLADALPVAVGDETESTEVDLQLGSRRRVIDAHGGGPLACSASLHREAGQGPVRDHHAFALEEDPDLDDGEPVVSHPPRDLLLLSEQRAPCPAVAVGADRSDRLDQPADQLVGELLLAASAVEAEFDGGRDVAPRRLAVDADAPGDGTLPLTPHPAPERLSYLDHCDLPERHGASSAAASEAQPNVSSAGVGGWSGWSHNWQRGWSHATGKTSGYVVPCRWQATRAKQDPLGALRQLSVEP